MPTTVVLMLLDETINGDINAPSFETLVETA
jgi:hypothetical protein